MSGSHDESRPKSLTSRKNYRRPTTSVPVFSPLAALFAVCLPPPSPSAPAYEKLLFFKVTDAGKRKKAECDMVLRVLMHVLPFVLSRL